MAKKANEATFIYQAKGNRHQIYNILMPKSSAAEVREMLSEAVKRMADKAMLL